MYLASGGRLSYTPSVERVVGWTIHENVACSFWKFHHFPITSCSRDKRYQALPAFLYCKRWKPGRGLGMRLPHTQTQLFVAYAGVVCWSVQIWREKTWEISSCVMMSCSFSLFQGCSCLQRMDLEECVLVCTLMEFCSLILMGRKLGERGQSPLSSDPPHSHGDEVRREGTISPPSSSSTFSWGGS